MSLGGMDPLGWLYGAWTRFRRRRVISAYQRLFRGADANLVLADLAKFCRANVSTFVADQPDLSAHYEGARRVYLHIQSMLDLDPQDARFPDETDED